MRSVRIAGACAAVAAAALASAAGAAASTLYAAPGRSDAAPCSSGDPCSLTTAIQSAGDNDDVQVAPGNYTPTVNLTTSNDIYVHGVPGQPRPVVTTDKVIDLDSAQSKISDFELRSTASGFVALFVSGTLIERVVVKVTPPSGGSSNACSFRGDAVVVRDVVCYSKADSGSPGALDTGDTAGNRVTTLRNVTAVVDGSGSAAGYGVYVGASGASGSHQLNVTNSIVRGFPRASEDFYSATGGSGVISGTISHTNYEQILVGGFGGNPTDDGTMQTALPAFLNLANGDLHEADGSPTIDAGVNAVANGAQDPDGVSRTIHGVTDIGAFEGRPADAVTGAASAITLTNATISGVVTPNGLTTSYHFEYGPTTSYGKSTPAAGAGAGGAGVPVIAALTGLKPDKTFHYRLVATNALGTTLGLDKTFTTAHDPFKGVRFPPHAHASVKGRTAKLRLSCPPGIVGPCTGKLVLTVRVHGKKHTVAKGKFKIKAGKSKKVKVKLTSAGLGLLGGHLLHTRGTATAHDGLGTKKTVKRRVDLAPA
ncbi:MAG: hypothetical protein QOD53_2343 [Thermoleophilaceae bacterium]|jgi:hypothetical protein|nr:hypothetical protein [Thermoleophilaceae bacterium]